MTSAEPRGITVGQIPGVKSLTFESSGLSGVVINDSIVLIDYFNAREKEGGDRLENIVDAVRRRFRPILITTMTTFIGLLPTIAETSIQAQFLNPMAVSLAFGILFSSILILMLVPAALALGRRRPALHHAHT